MTSAPADLVRQRHRQLTGHLDGEGLDGLLVTSRANVAYLTGFFGSAGVALVTREGATLISDARYAEEIGRLGRDLPHVTPLVPPGGSTVEEALVQHIGSAGLMRLGFESSHVTFRQHRDLSSRLASAGTGVELVATDGVVERLRLIKDAWEVATLREAGRRLSDVAKCIIPRVLAGTVERELAAVIEAGLRQKGFDRPAFDTIVASGPNAALPHHRAGERRLEVGDLVVIDFGGYFRGYAVDMTRTVILGPPTARQRDGWEAVARAQRVAFEAARVGVDAEAVDEAARASLAEVGLDGQFTHSLGHGLGLDVHERPRLSRRRPGAEEGPLQAGMVFTLEPGIYVPGWGGVRIEDDVLAAAAGPEWLTEPLADVRAT